MPASYVVIDELSLLVTVIAGDFPEAEVGAVLEAERADPRAVTLQHHLVDLRQLTGALPRHDVVMRLGEAAAAAAAGQDPARGTRRTAIVAPEDHVYGVSRMFQAYADGAGGELEVFRSMDDAWAWLGVRPAAGGA